MERYFERRSETAVIRDFTDGFREKTLPIEVRTDHFTGRVSRILKFRWKIPQSSHDPALIEKARETCPFCPDRIEKGTPKFPESLIPEGRIRRGEATVLPNAFPYCPYCAVTVFAHAHYIPLRNFTREILVNAALASREYIERVREKDPSVRYASINWNYMPTSGGSLFHPHFQVVAHPDPTHFHARLLQASARHRALHSSVHAADLIAYEKARKERFLFEEGPAVFLACFAPGGIFSEVVAIFRGITRLNQMTEAVWEAFFQGVLRLLRCFDRLHLDNHNMTLLLSLDGDDDMWLQARIMPRILIPPWGTSDVNYFEKGHREVVTIFSPEDLAEEIRKTD